MDSLLPLKKASRETRGRHMMEPDEKQVGELGPAEKHCRRMVKQAGIKGKRA